MVRELEEPWSPVDLCMMGGRYAEAMRWRVASGRLRVIRHACDEYGVGSSFRVVKSREGSVGRVSFSLGNAQGPVKVRIFQLSKEYIEVHSEIPCSENGFRACNGSKVMTFFRSRGAMSLRNLHTMVP